MPPRAIIAGSALSMPIRHQIFRNNDSKLMDTILKLKNRTPLTQGASRLVFEHPDDPDLLVKVIRPEVVDDRFGKNTKWYKRRRRFGKYSSYIREIQEYLAVREKCGEDDPFLQRIVGFARTDMGLGLALEAVKWVDGSLAPSLRNLIHTGRFDSEAHAALETFLDGLLRSPVIISDINMGNIVCSFTEERGYHFVLIDGIGNNGLIPFKAISKTINRRSKLGRFKRLRARIERSKSRHPQENE
jgi:hypothetical protein